MASCVGLTSGIGGEGACITSRMYFGGWLYPDGEFDCAATGADTAQAKSAPSKRDFKAFRTDISFLRFNSRAKSVEPTQVNTDQKASTSTIAFANSCGASWGKSCPTPPVTIRLAYLPENFLA